MDAAQGSLAAHLELPAMPSLGDIGVLVVLANRVAEAPAIEGTALASTVWERRFDEIDRLLVACQRHTYLEQENDFARSASGRNGAASARRQRRY